MLIADNVSFAYRHQRVLHAISLGVQPGSLMGILGPNGSGKTTLLRLLAGTLRPDSGSVRLDGSPIASLARGRVARQIAVVPQETHLAFEYTVLEIVLMGRYPHLGPFQLEGPGDLAIARDALRATGTADLETRSFMTLSGGEKQRVIIASALAQLEGLSSNGAAEARPRRVLLLDEPTASLDLSYQIEVAGLLGRLNRELGIAVVVSTHDLQFAARVCRELVLLRAGRVVATGPTRVALTPETIAAVYGVEAQVRHDPDLELTTVLPVARIETPAGLADRPSSR